MPLFVSFGVFLIVLVSATLYGHFVYVRPSRVYGQLSTDAKTEHFDRTRLVKGIRGLMETIGRRLPFDNQRAARVRDRLSEAGIRTERAVFVVSGSRIFLLAGAFFLGSAISSHGRYRWLIITGLALLAYRLPEFFLRFLVNRRKEQLALGLPDALDLIVVCAEAGLGLDQAMRNVTREIESIHPALAEEFSLTSLEMTAGVRRAEALRNLGNRTSETELRKLVAVLIQADRFGTGLAEALRSHAEYLRTRRTQLAEERAGKVGVKLVFPIFFFILPSLLLVAAGPAIIAISKTLLPALQGMGN